MKQEIAVYGKGGIGKSTISANLSAAMAVTGRKVLQIGCDPKHDSTRLLMHGENIQTVMEYLKETEKELQNPADILRTGFMGTGCIENGGPRPGVGCAGRGIISSFEFLEKFKVKEQYDTVVYDVLGDVVCGGFAVPIRREYADVIVLVTSGEYMALYAANNILRGIRSYDGDTECRVAGIVFNERKLPDEDGRVQRFADAVGLPILKKVPRSDAFARAELEHVTLQELDGCEVEKTVFQELAQEIRPGMTLYPARPLEDQELETVVLQTENRNEQGYSDPERLSDGKERSGDSIHSCLPAGHADEEAGISAAAVKRLPLYGCAFNGAITCGVHLTDALIIAHSPRACAFYTWQNISSPGRKNLFNRGILMPSAIAPHFTCTDMGQTEAVFGGTEKLKEAVQAAIDQKPGAVIVVSSCVSGIIGDDLLAAEALGTEEVPVITIPADGDIRGDYMEGIRMCMHKLGTELIDRTVRPSGKCVNLINEVAVSVNHETNYRIIRDLLAGLGIEINCRFLGDTGVQELKNFLKAPLNILAADTQDGRELRSWLEQEYGCSFAESAFPIGARAAKQFLEEVAAYFGCSERVPALIRREEEKYQREIERLRPELEGKRVVITTINSNIDFVLQAAEDAGMEILQIGVINYLRQEVKVSDTPERYNINETMEWEKLYDQAGDWNADFVISNYTPQAEDGAYVKDSIPMMPLAGYSAGIDVIRRWADLQRRKREGAWNHDRVYFEQYVRN
ncbi:MAG: nitrogenase component 1 [Lachnospiraceae bacterium]|nr:nitrogenase component 1 [Lachnospiraceae bacterium]